MKSDEEDTNRTNGVAVDGVIAISPIEGDAEYVTIRGDVVTADGIIAISPIKSDVLNIKISFRFRCEGVVADGVIARPAI